MFDAYAVLGLTRSATLSDVKDAYRKISFHTHPRIVEKFNPKDASSSKVLFFDAAEAFEILSDSRIRGAYDKEGYAFLSAGEKPLYTFDTNAERVFESFFGTNNPFLPLLEGVSDKFNLVEAIAAAPKLDEVVHPIEVSLEDINVGVSRAATVTVQQGEETAERTVTVSVRPGEKSGINLKFEGDKSGLDNHVFQIKQSAHSHFSRDGANLKFTANITLFEALAGTVVTVTTLDGRKLNIPIDTVISPGTVKVVPEEGLPDVDHPGKKGSLLISFNISFPEKVSMEAAQQLRKLLP